MTDLRAPDIKDEHGWQVVNAEGEVVAHASSRDKARLSARNGFLVQPILPDEVLPADNSPEALAARAAQEVHERIVELVHVIQSAWIDLAETLYLFKQAKMWDDLGYATFDEYIASPELPMERRWAFDHIAIYEQLVVDRGVNPARLKQLAPSKVTKVLPAIRRNQATIDEALSDAKMLRRPDLELKYSGRASSTPGRPSMGTKVETDEEPAWAVCPTCGTRKQVDPKTNEFLR